MMTYQTCLAAGSGSAGLKKAPVSSVDDDFIADRVGDGGMSSKALIKTPKVRKALTKKAEHLREHLGVPASSRALFPLSGALFVQWCPCPRLGTTEGTTARIVKTANASALCHHDERHIIGLALRPGRSYRSTVAANSATGFGDPKTTRRNSAPIPIAGAFFVPALQSNGGCAWETFVSAGFRVSRFANLRTAATHCLATMRGGSLNTHGARPMTTLIPSNIRAFAHRRMALSALRANSSLSVRLKRYNHHMNQARALEAQGGAA